MPVKLHPRRRAFLPALLVIGGLALAPSLAGCGAVEGIIESQTGGDVDLGGPGLPEGFPSAEVPLIEGDVLFGAGLGSGEGTVWNVTVAVADMAAFDRITLLLQDAGFTLGDSGVVAPTEESATGVFDSPKYGVLVVVTADGNGGFAANYSVTQKAQ